MKKTIHLAGVFATLLLVASCKNEVNFELYSDDEFKVIEPVLNIDQTPASYTAQLPKHLSQAGLAGSSIDVAKATLGRVLFYDKDLSSDKTVNCASCHRQEIAFSDDRKVSLGVEERAGTRNSIALGSVASFSASYGTDFLGQSGIPFFWDNRVNTASDQNIASMTNPMEMNMLPHQISEAVQQKAFYKPLFHKAFGDETITTEKISAAIAEFVNALGSTRSRFDQGADASLPTTGFALLNYSKNFSNFSAAENRGKVLYINNCASCHSENFGQPVMILANNGLDAETTDPGVGGITAESSQMGMFKVPTLRNIALTGPYMHDGRFTTLEQVMEHYSTGVKLHPNLSGALKTNNGTEARQFNFSQQDKDDLIAFLNTLTDYEFISDKRFSNPFK